MSQTDTRADVSKMFQQAAALFENAMEAGIKLQEQTTKSFSRMMSQLGSPETWQQRTQAAVEQTLSTAQQNLDETMRVMTENAKTSLDLLQEAFENRPGESGGDAETKTRELWETAMGSLRRNTEVMVQANNRVLESWKEIAKIMRGDAAEVSSSSPEGGTTTTE